MPLVLCRMQKSLLCAMSLVLTLLAIFSDPLSACAQRRDDQ